MLLRVELEEKRPMSNATDRLEELLKQPAFRHEDAKVITECVIAIIERLAWLTAYRQVAAAAVRRDGLATSTGELAEYARDIADGCLPTE
jgi:hypothetical protein